MADICGEIDDIDVATVEDLREAIKKIIKACGTKKVRGFSDKHVGKPVPWDGEQEAEFKTWNEKFTAFMGTAGDKVWRAILKELQKREDDDDELEDIDDVKTMFKDLNIEESTAEEMSETLYDQLTQYVKGELLADVQMAGPLASMEAYRKAYAHGRKKTAENVHRARNRVSRPEIAETMEDLDEKYKKWKKDISYLKNIDAYDYGDAGMISILLDMIPDEVQREITTQHKTTGNNSAPLKKIMIEVEKIIEREKDRKQSRGDRKPETHKKKLAAISAENEDLCQVCVWDQDANHGYGGYLMVAKRSRDEEDEEGGSDKRRKESEASGSGENPPKGKGKGKGEKRARKCFTCGEEGHYKAQCPNNWYMPKTVWGSWWNTLPFAKGKGKGKGGKGDSGKGGKGKAKGKGQFSPPVNMMEEYGDFGSCDWPWSDGAAFAEGEWKTLGRLSRSTAKAPTKSRMPQSMPSRPLLDPTRGAAKFNFKVLEPIDEDEISKNDVDEQNWMKRIVVKTPKTKLTQKNTKSKDEQEVKKRKLVKVKDENEMDAIIKEHMKHMNMKRALGMLTKIGDSTISPCTREEQGWKKLSMAVDSGACENVIDAEEEVPNYPIAESRASKMGVKYASATGEEIANLGQVVLPMLTSEGTKRRMTMQAAEVSKPLASVKRICEAGHTVVFDETGSFMFDKTTGEVNYFREEAGNYMLDVWIPPNRAGDFPRQ